MMTLEFTNDELEKINYDENIIKNILVSRAIYNESYNYEFTDEQKLEIKYLEQNEAIKLYMRKTVAPRLMVNENTIIDRYNENKSFFEEQKISFKDARELIKQQLNEEINYGLEQDLVASLVHNMEEDITLTKEDLVFTKGDTNLIKGIAIFKLVKKEAEKNNFFVENEEEIDTVYKEVRIKYFVNIIASKDINVTQEEISKIYVDYTKEFEGVDINEAYNRIYVSLYQRKLDENTNNYINSIIEKYNIEEEVKKYKKNDDEVVS